MGWWVLLAEGIAECHCTDPWPVTGGPWSSRILPPNHIVGRALAEGTMQHFKQDGTEQSAVRIRAMRGGQKVAAMEVWQGLLRR